MSSIRLDRYLADVQIGSRRQIRLWLKDGRVQVNGTCVTRADERVDTERDTVVFDGKTLVYRKYRYLMLNKPQGVVTATRDGLSKTVLDLLNGIPVRGLSAVGRLDKDTEGLLLLTDDGQLLHALISPASAVEKVYEVHLKKPLTDAAAGQLEKGVDIGDETETLPASVARLPGGRAEEPVILLTLREGRFHQIKRMLHAVGNEVVFLKRLSVGGVTLDPALKPGAFRLLTAAEIEQLCAVTGRGQTAEGALALGGALPAGEQGQESRGRDAGSREAP